MISNEHSSSAQRHVFKPDEGVTVIAGPAASCNWWCQIFLAVDRYWFYAVAAQHGVIQHALTIIILYSPQHKSFDTVRTYNTASI